jgi:hypothetical protein
MSCITVDRATQEKLREAVEPVEVVDDQGVVLGTFQPAHPGREIRLPDPPPLSEEEWQRRRDEPGRSLPDILDDLRKRA